MSHAFSPNFVPISGFVPRKNCEQLIRFLPEGCNSVTLTPVSLPVATTKPSSSIATIVPASADFVTGTFSPHHTLTTCPAKVV
ncbi:CG31439-PA, putative [Bacillus cereus G9241]|nr:CG31439-PA, putative [Bacillus cereus G9241]